ncbi:MAG: hypothetical protein IBJ03_08595 [Gemmatimonadaceae bacterium]|nr:hypothetical protein [Gemmatimonadaceae bacterium]
MSVRLSSAWSATALRIITCALIGVVVSCTSPTEACGCSPTPPSTLVVKGVVLNASQTPVAGLIVRATVFERSCTSLPPLDDNGVRIGQTDTNGRFRLELMPVLSSGVALDSACVRVSAFAAPETSAELGSTTKANVRVPLLGQPRDSAEFVVLVGGAR